MKPNIKMSKGKTIKSLLNGMKKLTIIKLIVIENIKIKEFVKLLKNAPLSPRFLDKKAI
ncbi:MAG: hypothetical protein ACTSUT_10100 [Promethearchaeota archaeon]